LGLAQQSSHVTFEQYALDYQLAVPLVFVLSHFCFTRHAALWRIVSYLTKF
jgi:hypothetical protein